MDQIDIEKDDDGDKVTNLSEIKRSNANQSVLIDKKRDRQNDDSDEEQLEDNETKSESGSSAYSAGSDNSIYATTIEDRNFAMRFLLSISLMLQKIYISFKRNYVPIILVLIFPLFLSISMKYMIN